MNSQQMPKRIAPAFAQVRVRKLIAAFSATTPLVNPTAMVGTEPNAVAHNDAGSGSRRGPGSPLVGEHREHRVDDNGQHMA